MVLERERGRVGGGGERKREREREIGCLLYLPQLGIEPASWVCALIGDQTFNLSVYETMLQPTELHSPGLKHFLIVFSFMCLTLQPMVYLIDFVFK